MNFDTLAISIIRTKYSQNNNLHSIINTKTSLINHQYTEPQQKISRPIYSGLYWLLGNKKHPLFLVERQVGQIWRINTEYIKGHGSHLYALLAKWRKTSSFIWMTISSIINYLPHTNLGLMTNKQHKTFENNEGIEEIANSEQISPFLTKSF